MSWTGSVAVQEWPGEDGGH